VRRARLIQYSVGGVMLAAALWVGVQFFSDGDGALLISKDAAFDPSQLAAKEKLDLSTAQKQAAEALARSEKLEAEAEAADNEADKYQKQAAAVAARIQSAEAQIQVAETALKAVNRQLDRHQQRLARQQKPLMELTALLQQMSRRPPMTVLAQPGSLDELVHARAVIEAVMPVIEEKSSIVRKELVDLRGTLRQQSGVMRTLEAGQAKLAVERQALTKLEQQGRARSQQLASSAHLEAERAIGLGERARDITALMASLEQDSQRRAILVQLAGPLPRPANPDDPVTATPPPPPRGESDAVRGVYRLPVVGRVLTGFGELDDSGVRSRGLQMAASAGAQVVAPAKARVSYAGEYRGYGKILILDHGGGWVSMIAGMIALSSAVGDEVEAGAPIGRAGAEGKAITVELRRNGKPLDILALIA
jgi:septal ring factor EnvC (AmiA/AmiB activator)